jgi:hypothetical protein
MIGSDFDEGMIVGADVPEISLRERSLVDVAVEAGFPNGEEAIHVAKRRRFQQNRLENAEHDDIGAHAERKHGGAENR